MEQPFNKNVDIKFSTHDFNFRCYVSIEKKIMETNLVLKDVIASDPSIYNNKASVKYEEKITDFHVLKIIYYLYLSK